MDDLRCAIFGQAERPACCSGLQASEEMCGEERNYAIRWLAELELATAPAAAAISTIATAAITRVP
jgi:hypothetical protein